MAISATGSVSLQDVEDEYGGTGGISLSEYYRSNTYGTVSGNNTNIPQESLAIHQVKQFRGSEQRAYIQYYIVGAGGGGGYGVADGSVRAKQQMVAIAQLP